MTVVQIVWRVYEAGADLRLGGPTGVELVRYRRVDPEMIETIRAHRNEIHVFLTRRALDEADTIIKAQRLLRNGLWPVTSPVCDFLIGLPGECCHRCGASWTDHYRKMSPMA